MFSKGYAIAEKFCEIHTTPSVNQQPFKWFVCAATGRRGVEGYLAFSDEVLAGDIGSFDYEGSVLPPPESA